MVMEGCSESDGIPSEVGMTVDLHTLRQHARRIWDTAVAAARPDRLLPVVLAEPELARALQSAQRILVVGCGKAGAGMAEGVELALGGSLDRVTGVVNVPAEAVKPLKSIHLHAA